MICSQTKLVPQAAARPSQPQVKHPEKPRLPPVPPRPLFLLSSSSSLLIIILDEFHLSVIYNCCLHSLIHPILDVHTRRPIRLSLIRSIANLRYIHTSQTLTCLSHRNQIQAKLILRTATPLQLPVSLLPARSDRPSIPLQVDRACTALRHTIRLRRYRQLR